MDVAHEDGAAVGLGEEVALVTPYVDQFHLELLALLLGASLGFVVLSALTLGFLLMLPVAGYMLFREGAAARKMYLPLGPFLAFGTLVVLLSGGVA